MLVPLLPSKEAGNEDAGTVEGEQCANRVELRSEDLEDDEGEGELAQSGSDVGAFEGPLCGSDFYELFVRQDDRPGTVHP